MSVAVNLSAQEAEIAFLEDMRSEFENRGYRFVVRPSRAELPDFFANDLPDAVALRSDKNVAIEVISRANPAARQSLLKIRQLLEGRPGWQFHVAHMGSEPGSHLRMPVPNRVSVLERAKKVESLAADGNTHAAFLLAWSLLEAALNSVRPDRDRRLLAPGTVVEALVMEGFISQEFGQSLFALTDLRYRVAHGDLTAEPSSADVATVLSAVRAALD
jgi:hypothetical protein